MKRTKLIWLALILFSLIILINLGGFIIELLFQFDIVNVDFVSIRKITVISLVLLISFLISGVFFIANLFRMKQKSIVWWNYFMLVSLLLALYKLVKPTIISNFVPYYALIISLIILIVWYLFFAYLRKVFNFKYGISIKNLKNLFSFSNRDIQS